MLGRIPYVDIWDNKPPGIFALIALIFSFYPKSLTALAIFEGLFILGCVTTVYLLVRKVLNFWPSAALSTVAAAVACNLLVYNERGVLTEIFLLWPATLSMLCFVKGIEARETRWILMAGFCAGLASLFKTPGLSPLLAQIGFIVLLVLYKYYDLSKAVVLITAGLAGMILAWLPAVLYFSSHGALADLFDATLFYNLSYGSASQPGLHSIIMNLLYRLEPVAPLTVSAAIATVIIVTDALRSHKNTGVDKKNITGNEFPWGILLVLWIFADLAGVMAGGRYYPHYFLALIPSLSVLAGFAYSLIVGPGNRSIKMNTKALIAVLLIIVGPLFFQQAGDLRSLRWLIIDGAPKADWQIVADKLNMIREPNDMLFIWGYQPGIFYETGMKSPSRLLDPHYLGGSEKARNKFGQEMFDSLEKNNPSFIVVRTSDDAIQAKLVTIFNQLKAFMNNSYELIDVVGKLEIYRKIKSG